MKQPIQLTPNDGVIHVDEVRVEDGVYAKSDEGRLLYITGQNINYVTIISAEDGIECGKIRPLKEYIERLDYNWSCFTLSGLRIVTEKPLTVEDLGNTDFVGIQTKSGDKGYVVCSHEGNVARFTVAALHGFDFSDEYCNIQFGDNSNSLIGAVKNALNLSGEDSVISAYRFTTAQELHKWLGEEEV